jgi:hypothetical protein
LLRHEFNKRDTFQVANDVKPMSKSGIKITLHQVLYASGIRTPLVLPQNVINYRRDIAMSHGFRKFFDTNCTYSGMNPIYIEWCMGHSLKGEKNSYFLPQPDLDGIYLDVLEGHDKSPGYLEAIDFLTINEENRLRHQVEKLNIRKDELESLQKQVEVLHQQEGKWEILEKKMNELDRRLGFV